MDDHLRLSELTGIANAEDGIKSFWPVNIALFLLGVAILVTAFYFLDPLDERWLYNPWTYAVATPMVLLGLSALLSLFVSRLVEKSMQLAFLLSMLIHLGLLIYAVNIVIFSRMWPDILESLAQQRHQLQRETLQANQYHRLATSTQTARKPDYMRPVPAQSQPTEVENTRASAVQLVPTEVARLVSPSPQRELVVTPHLLPRQAAELSTPTVSPQLASLSRSDVTLPLESSTAASADLPSSLDSQPPQVLRPNEFDRRREAVGALSGLPSPVPVEMRRSPAATSELLRAESNPNPSSTPPSLTRQPAVSLPRSQPMADSSASRPIATPERLSQPNPSESLAANASTVRRQSDPVPALSNRLPATVALPESPQVTVTRPPASELRRTSDITPPTASSGMAPMTIAKDIAGGRPGTAGPLSMPILGPQSIAADQSPDSRLLTPTRDVPRRSSPRSAGSALPNPGLPQAPQWNGQANPGGQLAGRSPAQLRREVDGSAAVEDIAGLQGAARDIERSAMGVPLVAAEVPVPAGLANLPAGDVGDVTAALADSAQSQLSNPLRPSRAGSSLPNPSATGVEAEQPSTVRASVAGIERQERDAASDGNPSRSISGDRLARTPLEINADGADAIPLPNLDVEGTLADDLRELSMGETTGRGERRATDSGRASNILDLEQPLGQGGVVALPSQTGPLLARRGDLENNLTRPQLDATRFARQSVGGPLGAGSAIALPQPAFQQRLDRLQDRQTQDQTALGPQTELAIERGLAFLAAHQNDDGSWRLQDYDTPLLMRSDTAATGLALLAFQGAGYTHQRFQYSETVQRGLQFLIDRQQASGDLYIRQDPASDQNAWLYSHSIASLALCEAYGMTQAAELREPAQRAVDFMLASQDPQLGGWRYRPGSGADTSVTGWFMMALKSGQLAGLNVPQKTFEGMSRYLSASQVSNQAPYLFRYNPWAADTPEQRHGLRPTAVMTSVGLLMRLYLGWNRDEPNMVAGADQLLEHLPSLGTLENSRRDTYYWYYATQVMFHMRGYHWKTWHDELYPLLIDNQLTTGDNAGSWDPLTPTPDLWARYGGRLYVTTMNLLSLEVSYRHLPLYEATAR